MLCGYNATVLAYGQTGSGKSFAMGCGAQPDAPPGLIQLTVGALFEQLPEGSVVRASFTQIYNEELQDLLRLVLQVMQFRRQEPLDQFLAPDVVGQVSVRYFVLVDLSQFGVGQLFAHFKDLNFSNI